MAFSRTLLGIMLALVVVWVIPAPVLAASIYTVSLGETAYTVNPLEKDITATNYYNYNTTNSSGNPAFGTESATGFFWLFEDINTSDISLGMIFNTTSTDGRFGHVTMTTTGFPDTAFVALSDDSSETATLINGTETWGWSDTFTDGAVVGGLNGEWLIDITIPNVGDLPDYWYFLNGPSSRFPESILLANSPSGFGFQIEAATAAVPAPATLPLLGSALGLIGFMGWKKRKAG